LVTRIKSKNTTGVNKLTVLQDFSYLDYYRLLTIRCAKCTLYSTVKKNQRHAVATLQVYYGIIQF
jgi:hypothetical protein